MAKKLEPIRVTGEGDISFKLLDISIESGGYIGSSAIIAHRPGISDRLVYQYLVASELTSKRSAIIFPFSHPLKIPYNIQPKSLDTNSADWKDKILPGSLLRIKSTSDNTILKSLAKLRKGILPRSTNDFPVIFVFDTIQRISPKLEEEIRILIREASMNKLSVWLHCPLTSIPPDLFSIIGNVSVIWPSKKEYDILKEHLSSDQIDFDGFPRSRGMLFISNIILTEGKGWQFTEMEYDELEALKGINNDQG
ncbi:MAG TPA: hypothetical protein DCX54_07115 [Flavobacteriales bacterium]|nr:hypothetical protein [Flavobacteriales bacterium]